jgi:multiple sugar transport system permease protein
MAGAVVIIIPVLIIFAVLQRYVVQGIAVTGLKD